MCNTTYFGDHLILHCPPRVSFFCRKIQENDEDADIEAITHLLSSALPAEASRTPTPPPAATPEPPTNQCPVHGSCCRADCCCLLLIKRADQSASSSGGKGMWGGRRCMTSYFCCLLLSLLTRKSVSRTAGGETGARGDSDWWCTHLVINFSYQLCCGASICNIYLT